MLGTDFAKDEAGRFLPTEGIDSRRRSLQAQTKSWERQCKTALAEIFEGFTLGWHDYLVTPGDGVFPRTDLLRKLLRELRGGRPSPDVQPIPSIDGLHPQLVARCEVLFNNPNHDLAVFTAFKCIEDAIRPKIHGQPDDVGVSLISKALNPKSPALRLSDVPAEQEAYHSLFREAIGAFKNPHSHRFVESVPEEAARLLHFASLLLTMIDQAPCP